MTPNPVPSREAVEAFRRKLHVFLADVSEVTDTEISSMVSRLHEEHVAESKSQGMATALVEWTDIGRWADRLAALSPAGSGLTANSAAELDDALNAAGEQD